jgi:hypothetical protein
MTTLPDFERRILALLCARPDSEAVRMAWLYGRQYGLQEAVTAILDLRPMPPVRHYKTNFAETGDE